MQHAGEIILFFDFIKKNPFQFLIGMGLSANKIIITLLDLTRILSSH